MVLMWEIKEYAFWERERRFRMEKRKLTILEWIGTVLALSGGILNAFVLKQSYYLWFFSNLFLFFVCFKRKHYGLTIVFLIQFIFVIVGLFYWK